MGSLLDAAVFNNADWCDGVCRALGRSTVFESGLWLNLDASPPFYPNAITTSRDATRQTDRLRALVDDGLPAGWAVKDSHASLDLGTLGFDILFEATWIVLPTEQRLTGDSLSAPVWRSSSSPADLAAWEAAWRRAQENPEPLDPAPVFGLQLVDNPDIRFLSTPGAD